MNAREFFELTEKVREAQKTYFATRMPDDLRRSKRLETELDREIKKVRNRIEQMKDTQTDLNFGHEG